MKIPINESLSFGWQTLKNNLGFIIGALLFVGAVNFLGNLIGNLFSMLLEKAGENFPTVLLLVIGLMYLAFFLGWIFISTLLQMGLLKIWLKFVDAQKPEFGDLFGQYPVFFRYLLSSILYGLIILGGTILLVIPGIIWAIKYMFFGYLVIDQKMGAIEALKASGKITMGYKWDLFVFGILCLLVNIAGTLLCLVGLLFTVPITMIAWAYLYRKLQTQIELLPQVQATPLS